MNLKNKKGMTLVEVLVTIAIFTIAVEGFTMLFIRHYQFNKFTIEEGVASANAQRTIEKVIKNVRRARQADNGAYPVKEAGDFDLEFYCDYDEDGDTERIRYFLENGALKQGVIDPVGIPVTYPTEDEEISLVVDYIINEANEPVFRYYNSDYPSDTVNNPLSTPASIADVRMVEIFLAINIDPDNAPENLNFRSFAQLRNISD